MRNAVATVQLYMMPGCGICHQELRFLTRRGVSPEVRWLSEPANAQWVDSHLAAGGGPRAPYLVVGSVVIDGFQPDMILEVLDDAGVEWSLAETDDRASVESSCSIPTTSLWVTQFLAGTVAFVDASRSAKHDSELDLGADANPVAVACSADGGIVAISDMAGGVVLIDGLRGSLLGETLETSTVSVPAAPADVVFDRRRNRFYVCCSRGDVVVSIAAGPEALTAASLAMIDVGPQPAGLVIDERLDRLFVKNGEGLVAIDLETFTLRGGTWATSTIRTGLGRNVVLDPATHRLFTAEMDGRVVYIDGVSGELAFGDLASSSATMTESPMGLAFHPGSDRLFVGCMGDGMLHALDPHRPGRLDVAPLDVGAAPRTLTLGPSGTLAVACFDDECVVFVDPDRLAYRWGGRAASTVPLSPGPRGMAFVDIQRPQ